MVALLGVVLDSVLWPLRLPCVHALAVGGFTARARLSAHTVTRGARSMWRIRLREVEADIELVSSGEKTMPLECRSPEAGGDLVAA
jgi:hypothetical protein